MKNVNQKNEMAWVKPVSDYGPIVIFFVAYKGWDLYTATAAIIVATGLVLIMSLAINGRVPLMPVITALVVGTFGGLTLIFNDATFIKMKPTIVQALFAAILFGGLLFGKPLLKKVMGSAWQMKEAGWRILTRNFGIFFLVMAGINEVVWRTQTEDFWVNFKVFGIIGLTLLFSVAQIPILTRHKIEESEG
ncbi:MAG: septation protein A [Pseudomonadota bacterium]|nr:septation protein A [Pseudomonadota bacterium]